MSVSLHEQIECIERELRYRERVYARRVSEGKMTQRLADRETDRMNAVLSTLLKLRDASKRDDNTCKRCGQPIRREFTAQEICECDEPQR